mgnify:CR=1 FL=1
MNLIDCYHNISKLLNFDDNGAFEARVILNHLLSLSYPFKDRILTDEELKRINDLVNKRREGYPLQYLISNWDFYDMNFIIGKGVLIPRPETEMIVDYVLNVYDKNESLTIADLCSGSGCIGMSLAKHLPNSKIYLIENSEEALPYIYKNIDKHNLSNVEVINTDLFNFDFDLINEKLDLIVSNPPYVPTAEISHLQKEVSYEPECALDGGADGLDFYKVFAKDWTKQLNNGLFILECGENQAYKIVDIFKDKYREYKILKDFNNIDRIVIFRI